MLEDKRLDKDVPIPLYFQLEKLILEEIDNGNYPVGSMIPTEMELSQMFGISRTTVRQAISDLLEIAEAMEKSPKSIDNALQRIRGKIREFLE